jgi:hypothetical protein
MTAEIVWIEAHRDLGKTQFAELKTWLHGLGLDLNRLADVAGVENCADGLIVHLSEYLLNESGSKYLDESRERAATRDFTVPGAGAPEWLRDWNPSRIRYRVRHTGPVEARRLTADNAAVIGEWIGAIGYWSKASGAPEDALFIDTVSGDFAAKPGDWVVRDSANDVFVCSPATFRSIYEVDG